MAPSVNTVDPVYYCRELSDRLMESTDGVSPRSHKLTLPTVKSSLRSHRLTLPIVSPSLWSLKLTLLIFSLSLRSHKLTLLTVKLTLGSHTTRLPSAVCSFPIKELRILMEIRCFYCFTACFASFFVFLKNSRISVYTTSKPGTLSLFCSTAE